MMTGYSIGSVLRLGVAFAVLLQVTMGSALAAREACTARNARDAALWGYVAANKSRPMSQTPFKNGTGQWLSIGDFRGRPVVLNFWATWCAPCVKEMPALNNLSTALQSSGIAVIALNVDKRGQEIVETFYRNLALNNLAIMIDDDAALMKASRVSSLPTTLLIDKNGNEVAGVLGAAEWDTPAVVSFLKSCLGDQQPKMLQQISLD